MLSDRKFRKFIRQWRGRYPYPVDWVDDRANKQCRRSLDRWLAQFEGTVTLRRREVLSLVFWRLGGSAELMERAVGGVTGPANWGHARRRIKKALSTSNPTEAFECLIGEDGIPGWGPEMASTLLSACRPDTYAVVDQRILRTLKALGLGSLPPEDRFGQADWLAYLRTCRRLAQLCGKSLRVVEQALWAAADDAPKLPKPVESRTRRSG